MATVIIVVVLAFVVIKLLMIASSIFSNFSSSSDTPPSAPAASGSADAPEFGTADSIRTTLLRQMLDAQGYAGVTFQLHGSSIALWGKVASEADRETIDDEASMVTGAMNLEDHLQVGD